MPRVEPDADDVVAAGGEVAGDGELLRGVRVIRSSASAPRAVDRAGGGLDGGRVTAGGLVDDDHEPRRRGRLALGLEHDGHATPSTGHGSDGEEGAGHTIDCNTYDAILQGRAGVVPPQGTTPDPPLERAAPARAYRAGAARSTRARRAPPGASAPTSSPAITRPGPRRRRRRAAGVGAHGRQRRVEHRANGRSSNPTTDTSSGIRRPSARAPGTRRRRGCRRRR